MTYQVSYKFPLNSGVKPKVYLFYVKWRSINLNKSY